ncbi:MAG: hypothetical protein INF84_12155 [Roseomonas sp.]|nr:hypothetical protein [Roseomonas sp.]
MPQHDLILDNGSGAAFRADANNALAALGSNMKGPNAPPVPFAGMFWWDDDTPSASIWTLRGYDGADWIEIGRLDVLNNVFSVAEGSFAPVDIASAATTNLGAATSPNVRITGTTAITSLGTAPAGTRRFLTFAAVLTITYNATSLQTPGLANIITAAGDNAVARSLGSGNWVIESYLPVGGYARAGAATGSGLTLATSRVLGRLAAGGGAIEEIPIANPAAAFSIGINRGTEQVISGTPVNVDFLNIPAGVRQIVVGLSNVGTNGASPVIIQLGSGSFLTSGYRAFISRVGQSSVGGFSLSAGIAGVNHLNAADTIDGLIILSATTNLRWASTGAGMIWPNSDCNFLTGGGVTLSGILDRLRITTVIGSQTFDNDCIFNISWSF